ncbi:hypothetical protein ACIOGZ_29750 [Kitasatospora sp. NPDC088160]|uniref:hypothetical protein n=1 Tax=Kitasatospora sp. NPDC088160 TaxID=3364072 RepID=UPI0038268C7F
MGAYVLSTMALQSMLQGHPDEAADMALGAYERAKGHAAPRVLAFAKLAEARALGRLGDTAAAVAALDRSEQLLHQVHPGTDDPGYLDYFTEARLAADAAEILRDLRQPERSLLWNQRATAMSSDRFARAAGIQSAVVATSHLQARDLDRGLLAGHRAVGILANVTSIRTASYLADVANALAPWRNEPEVRNLIGIIGRTTDAPSPATA